jgi:hypothetical protein
MQDYDVMLNLTVYIMLLFIGLLCCLKQILKLIFKVRDQGYRYWLLFKFNVYVWESILWLQKISLNNV